MTNLKPIVRQYRRRIRNVLIIGWLGIPASILLMLFAGHFGFAERIGYVVLLSWLGIFCFSAYETWSVCCPRCKARLLLSSLGYYNLWSFLREPLLCHRCDLNLSQPDQDKDR